MIKADSLIKRIILIVLCIALCTAQFVLPESAYGAKKSSSEDEETEEDEESSEDEDSDDEEDEEESSRKREAAEKEAKISSIKQQIEEAKAAKDKANATKDALASGMASVQQVIGSLQSKKNDVVSYVATLDAAMEQIQDDLAAINESISENRIQIDDAQKEIERATDELEEAERVRLDQYENIKSQIHFMYTARKATFADILFSSGNMGDLLNRTRYISEIMEYDQKKLEEYADAVKAADEAKAALEEDKRILEEKEAELEKKQEEAKAKEADMSDLISAKEAEIGQYNAEIGNKEAQVKEYKAMIAQQDAEIAAIEAAIRQQQAALAEADRRVYGGGQFAWPAPSYTRISDDYGMRIHPTLNVKMLHNGVDMAAPSGSPILAAADGTVIAASYSATMGNYIMIDHGSDLITIYMHASALSVSAGQEVSKGSRIGTVGSTGRSTGPHLHFGVRKGGAYVNPWGYLK